MRMHPYDISVSQPFFVSQADPAAAAILVYNIPDKSLMRFNSIRFSFTTDANVADRYVLLRFYSIAGKIVWESSIPFAATASLAFIFSFGISSAPNVFTATNGVASFSLPDHVRLSDTGFVEIRVTNIQVGDQIADFEAHVDEWIDIARIG